MKCSLSAVLLVATIIGLAYAYPYQGRSSNGVSPWSRRAPYFVQRYGRIGRVGPLYDDEIEIDERGRAYKITKNKKSNKKKVVVEDEPEDEEEQDEINEESEEDDIETADEERNDEEDILSIPLPFEKLFPTQENLPRGQKGQGQGGGPPGGYSSGPPQGGGEYGGGGGGPPGGYRRSLYNIDGELYQPVTPQRHNLRYRDVQWVEDELPRSFYPVPNRGRSNYPIYRNHLDRTGKQTRIITGWSDTVLKDNYNPEYIVNPTLMRSRRRHRYHPSHAIPIQKIPIRSGYYGNPRDVYHNPYGGQQWTSGPFEPYIYSH